MKFRMIIKQMLYKTDLDGFKKIQTNDTII